MSILLHSELGVVRYIGAADFAEGIWLGVEMRKPGGWKQLGIWRNRVKIRFISKLKVTVKAHANGHNKSQHCYVLLGAFGQQCCVRLHGPKILTGFKLYATRANIVVVPCKRAQHVGPNNVACCWPTMLRPFAWALRCNPDTVLGNLVW